ncbi:hypothetical protein QQF64_018890 [Cirrhinus molitorella]|uniref:G-protein coupled receptors family 2 profile 2 domain-containing protein n=1 Tax=Cirrhinus molitorella TaxID=172907 RepID=A0ABR3LHB6_9TELE
MDYKLLLLIFSSAVFEKSWCLNNSLNVNNTDNSSTTITPLDPTVTEQSSSITTITTLDPTTTDQSNSITTITTLDLTMTDQSSSIATITPLYPTTTDQSSTLDPTTTDQSNSITTITTLDLTMTDQSSSIATITPLYPTTTDQSSTLDPTTTDQSNSITTITTLDLTMTDQSSSIATITPLYPTTTDQSSTLDPTTTDQSNSITTITTLDLTMTDQSSSIATITPLYPTTTDQSSTLDPTTTDQSNSITTITTLDLTMTDQSSSIATITPLYPTTTDQSNSITTITTLDLTMTDQSSSIATITHLYPTTTDQSSTLDPTTTDQSNSITTITTLDPTTTDQSSTLDPTTTDQSSTLDPTTTEQSSTLDPTTTDQSSTLDPTTTEQSSTLDPTTTDQSSTLYPTTTDQSSTLDPTTTDQNSTLDPTTTDQNSTLYSTTTNQSNSITTISPFNTTVTLQNNSITTISPLHTTVTIPILVCQNGGTLQHGICICQDDWTGPICNTSNFCLELKPTPSRPYTFPKTLLGQFASSIERCPQGTTNAGMHQASALCNRNTHLFDPPNILNCSLTLDNINAWLSGATLEQKQNLASSTQILTSIPERLTPHNITNAAQIVNTLLSDLQLTQTTNIAVSAVATVSQLLNASHEMFTSVNTTAISELTQTLQEVSLREEPNPLLVQPNMAVQSLKGEIKQVQLTAFKGQSDNFSPDRIKLNTTEAEIGKEGVDLQMNVAFSEGFGKDVGFVLYDNDQFFQSKSFQPSLDTKRRVISANLQENFGTVQFEFTVTPSADSMSLNDFACVFWSYSENDWITDGCIKLESPSGSAVCSCKNQQKAIKQKVNFAILMAYHTDYKYSEALHWMSITGCALSVLGLSATALYQIKTRKARGGSPTLLVVNICLSMMVFYLFFIFGINNPVQHVNVTKESDQNKIPDSDYYKYPDEGPCTAFTALLQYFLLATFTWNTLYGVNVFMLFQNSVSGTPQWFSKVSMAVGWGLPAVIVGISLGSTYRVEDPLGYRQEEFCWLASVDHKLRFNIKKPMFWGFVLPLMIMLITNTAILLHFSYNICKTNPKLNRSRTTPLKKKILSSFSLAVMLGLSWLTGYILLITQEKTLQLILSVVFCLLTTSQGVQIFILFALRPFLNSNPAILNSLHSPEIGLHKKTFYLWKKKTQKNKESYQSTDHLQDKPI